MDIFVKSMQIRCCVAYGPQESSLIERKHAFWTYLDEEVFIAENIGSGLVLHFDGNLWAGSGIIPGDPRPQNRNGKLFEEFLSRHPQLTVVNALSLCEGLITRRRMKDGKLELSVLDFFVVCSRVLPHITKMVNDENKKYILTNYGNVRKGGKANDTDHVTQYMDLDLKVILEKPERIEILNFKDKIAQSLFKKITFETTEFSNCFNNNLPVLKQVDKWRQTLDSHCKRAFKKIRINNKKRVKPPMPNITKLINERNKLLNENAFGNEKKVKEMNEQISELEAEENRNIIVKHFKCFSDNPDTINLQQVWKSLKKIWPKQGTSLPTAKRNHNGKIVSSPSDLKKLLAKEYKERLRTRPLRPDIKDIKERRNQIFELKMKLASKNKTKPWVMDQLESVLSNLKNNKSRDHEGFINEIFKPEAIGDDLKKSLLLMFNKLKKEKEIPRFMNYANITTVHKKGPKIELKNQRGIFRVSVPTEEHPHETYL